MERRELTVGDVVERARAELSRLTALELASTVGVVKDEEGWHVSVELIERKSVPDGMDVLGIYESLLDDDGNLVSFSRRSLRKRIDTELPE